MDALNVAQAYFDAWNRRDTAAINGAFAAGCTYSDPASGGTLAGEAIGRYAAGLFEAFPDLAFDVISASPAGDGRVAAEWLMRGTNTGPLFGGPPTGKTVALEGADFLTIEGNRVRSVKGYFDQKTFVEQLGLQTTVQPYAIGPVTFGTALHMNAGNFRKPGAFSITWIRVRDKSEWPEIERRSQAILESLATVPSFIGAVLTTVGLVGHTITAWTDPEAPKQLLREGPHREAMARFFGPELAVAGITSVWVPGRIGSLWMRCEACAQMIDGDSMQHAGKCRCGAALPERLPYF